jgi:hypothetical protein
MNVKVGARRSIAITVLFLGCWLMIAGNVRAQNPTPPVSSLAIDHIAYAKETGQAAERKDPTSDKEIKLGLNDSLAVVLKGDASGVDVRKALLVLNGRPIPGLADVRVTHEGDVLLYRLVRNSDNLEAWKPILGSPDSQSRPEIVTLQLGSAKADTPARIIAGDPPATTFQFVLLSPWWVVVGTLAVLIVIIAVVGGARRTNLLRDSLLPQLPPHQQTYSLGRCQMAFWFALVFASFVFLLLLLWDYNTVTPQALILMGLSGATAIFAIQIDASKDTAIGGANETLRMLGIKTYNDVVVLKNEIRQRSLELNNTQQPPSEAEAIRLKGEILDRQNRLRTWQDLTAPFVTQGWYRDLTTDVNGPALHRLQVFYWTIILGVVFIVAVYRELAMPVFSDTLLALMGVTSAGYLGFKYPEKQS